MKMMMIVSLTISAVLAANCRMTSGANSSQSLESLPSYGYAKVLMVVAEAADDLELRYFSATVQGMRGIAVGGDSVSDTWITVMFDTVAAKAKFEALVKSRPDNFRRLNDQWLYIPGVKGNPAKSTLPVRMKLGVVVGNIPLLPGPDGPVTDIENVSNAKDDLEAKYPLSLIKGFNGSGVGGTSESDTWISINFESDLTKVKFERLMARRPNHFTKIDGKWLYIHSFEGIGNGPTRIFVPLKVVVIGSIVIQ